MGVKRILFIDHTASLGGGEIALLNLVRTLDRSLIAPSVLLFSDGPLVERMRPFAETYVLSIGDSVLSTRKDSLGMSSIARIGTIWTILSFIRKVRRFIRRGQYDLVLTNSLKSDIIGGIAARLVGRPVIWHVRDRISSDYLPAAAVRGFQLLACLVPTYVVAISNAVRHTLGPKLAIPERSVVVLDGVDVHEYTPHVPTKSPVIGMIGRISPWKGQDVVIKAAALVKWRCPDATFRIIGAPLFGETAYRNKLFRLVSELGLEQNVTFDGFVSDIRRCISELDAIVHASTIAEPFGQVVAEAMAEGKPVIASAGGGVLEIIEDGVSGILVPMGSEHDLADAICKILEDPSYAMELGKNARRRIEAKFRIERVARQMEFVFRSVLEHKPLEVTIPSTGVNSFER